MKKQESLKIVVLDNLIQEENLMETIKDIGTTFRLLRKERGFTLKEMSAGIISFSYLSKFEKGENQISLTNFIQLAQRLNMTVDEILYFSTIKTTNHAVFFQKVSMAHAKRDLSALMHYLDVEQKLFEETNINYHKYNAIMIAVTIKDIDDNFSVVEYVPNVLVDYLLDCDYWSTYKISLFGNTLTLFPKDLLHVLLKETEKRVAEYRVMNRNYRELIRLIENACIIFLRRKEVDQVTHLLNLLSTMIRPSYYFEKIRQTFINDIVILALEDSEKGEKKAKQTIEVMRFFDEQFADNHMLELQALLKIYRK